MTPAGCSLCFWVLPRAGPILQWAPLKAEHWEWGRGGFSTPDPNFTVGTGLCASPRVQEEAEDATPLVKCVLNPLVEEGGATAAIPE